MVQALKQMFLALVKGKTYFPSLGLEKKRFTLILQVRDIKEKVLKYFLFVAPRAKKAVTKYKCSTVDIFKQRN